MTDSFSYLQVSLRFCRLYNIQPSLQEKLLVIRLPSCSSLLEVNLFSQGRIIFHESKEFWIELVTTTPEGQNHSKVKALYTSIDNNTILLQVVSTPVYMYHGFKASLILFSRWASCANACGTN